MSNVRQRAGLLTPAMAVIGVLLVLPLCLMAFVSTLERGPDGGVIWSRHTLDPYVQFLFERDLMDRLVLNTDYLQIFA
ncbi:MAG: ABC transporter permease, partial [Hyphomicrobiales bacterium]|nr:ABC transporter permease [Hyphomicrobiales bacterium]